MFSVGVELVLELPTDIVEVLNLLLALHERSFGVVLGLGSLHRLLLSLSYSERFFYSYIHTIHQCLSVAVSMVSSCFSEEIFIGELVVRREQRDGRCG